MSKNQSQRARRVARRSSPRRLSVRGILRREPDLEKLAGSMAALAIASAEKAAADQHQRKEKQP